MNDFYLNDSIVKRGKDPGPGRMEGQSLDTRGLGFKLC